MKNSKKQYDVIVFDLGNTLIRFDHRIAARKLSARFGVEREKIYSTFFDSEFTRDFEKGLIKPAEFHRRIEKFLGFKISYKEFVKIWNDIFWEDKDACALARILKKKYKIFLLSNVNRLHFEFILRKFDILKIFDEIVASFAVGAMKPDKKIYDHVVHKAGCDMSRILYIDDREDLVKEARRLGIDSIRFEGASKLKSALTARGILA